MSSQPVEPISENIALKLKLGLLVIQRGFRVALLP
jgi:hypothetical protein